MTLDSAGCEDRAHGMRRAAARSDGTIFIEFDRNEKRSAGVSITVSQKLRMIAGITGQAWRPALDEHYFAAASAASTSSLCFEGLTPVQTFAILPDGSMRNVLREAIPRWLSDPY